MTATTEKLVEEIRHFVSVYKARYKNTGKAGLRSNAPMLQEVTVLNGLLAAWEAEKAAEVPICASCKAIGAAYRIGTECGAAMPSVEPLTDEEVNRLVVKSEVFQYHPGAILEFARDVERACAKKRGVNLAGKDGAA